MNSKPLSVNEILWENVSLAMLKFYGKENLTRLAKDAKIGPGTASRIKECKTSVGIDVVSRVAAVFDLEPWHLLMPNLDPKNPPVATMSHDERKLYDKLKQVQRIMGQ